MSKLLLTTLLILYMPPGFTKDVNLSDCLVIPNVSKTDTVHMMLAALRTQKDKGFVVSGSEHLKDDKLSQTIKTRSSNYVNLEYLKNIKNHTIKGQLYACYQEN